MVVNNNYNWGDDVDCFEAACHWTKVIQRNAIRKLVCCERIFMHAAIRELL